MRSLIGVGIAVAILFSAPKIAAGQNGGESTTPPRAITGVVRDTTGAPIVAVQVRLDGHQVTVTDSSGRFRLTGVSEASLPVTFRRLGYEPVTRMVQTRDALMSIDVTMTPNQQLLRTIVVKGEAYDKDLWANGFYHRRKVASGSFFDPDFLAHFGGDGLAFVMHEVPRVDIMRKGDRDYAFSTIGGNRCRMNVYIDGMFQRAAMPGPVKGADDAVGLNELIDYRDIRAIEVYPRASSVPTQFSRMGPNAGPQGRPMPRIASPVGRVYASSADDANADAACGAIVIWTKDPGDR